jgi:hypothetical protein
MIEFIDRAITENVTQSIVITYPRKVCISTGIYPVVEDIHNLMMLVKNNLNPNVSYSTNVKGGMTGWKFFLNDPLFIKFLNFLINTHQEADPLKFRHFYERYTISAAWGNQIKKTDYVRNHKHNCVHGILYLTTGAPLIIPELKLKVHPKPGQYMVFPAEIEHYVEEETSDQVRYNIVFNAEQQVDWEQKRKIEEKFELDKTK